jgi:hypothetical protein
VPGVIKHRVVKTLSSANKAKSPKRNAEMRRLITAAHKAYEKEQQLLQKRMPGIPVSIGAGWPHIAVGPNVSKINQILFTPRASRKRLVQRLKAFEYPYPEGNKRGKTFYTHVESLGHLKYLLEPPFLWEIRRAWFFRLDYELEKQQKIKLSSQYNYPLEFHLKMMHESLRGLQRIIALAKKFNVPKMWIADYFAGAQKQLLKEAGICYPEMLRGFIPNSRIYPRAKAVETQLSILKSLLTEFKRKGKANNKLAYQLTALICSGDSCVTTKILDPNPEAVRTSERDDRKKTKQAKGWSLAGTTQP